MGYKYDEARMKELERGFSFFERKAGTTDESVIAESGRINALYGEAFMAAEEFYKYLAERDEMYKETYKPEHQDLLLAETKYLAKEIAKHRDISFQIVEGMTSKPQVPYVGRLGNFSAILDMVEKELPDKDKLTSFVYTLKEYDYYKDKDLSKYNTFYGTEKFVVSAVVAHFTKQ